jgi:hypothetical protein
MKMSAIVTTVIENSKSASAGASMSGPIEGGAAQGNGGAATSSKEAISNGYAAKAAEEAASKNDVLNTYLDWKGGSSNTDLASWRASLGLQRSSNWKVIERYDSGCMGHWHWLDNKTFAKQLLNKWRSLRAKQLGVVVEMGSESTELESQLAATSCTPGRYVDATTKACKQCPSGTYQTSNMFLGTECQRCSSYAEKHCGVGTYLAGCGGSSEGFCKTCRPPQGVLDMAWVASSSATCDYEGYVEYIGYACSGAVESRWYPLGTSNADCRERCNGIPDKHCAGVQVAYAANVCHFLFGSVRNGPAAPGVACALRVKGTAPQ